MKWTDKHTRVALHVAVIAAVAGGAYWLIFRKSGLTNTGASGKTQAPNPNVVPNQPTGGGNQAYTNQANVVIRTSPGTNDPFIIFGGNVALTVAAAASWLGTVISITPDTDGAINPVTQQAYNWYQLVLSSTLATSYSVPATGSYYVREDFVTVK